MTDAKSKEPVDDEIFEHLPPAFKLLVEFARERGLIESRKQGQAPLKQHKGGKPDVNEG